MQLTKEEYLAMEEARQNRTERTNFTQRPRVGYLNLRDDGDEAIVRFAYSDITELYTDVVTCHPVTIDGKFRKVSCLRRPHEEVEKCPLCASGKQYEKRVYIRLIEYTRDESGTIVATPKVWDRPRSYVDILSAFFTEYGDISNCIFKVRRSGAAGSRETNYSILFGNPTIYSDQIYKKDFSAFEGYNIVGGPVLDKSYEEVAKLAGLEDLPYETPTLTLEYHKPTMEAPQQNFAEMSTPRRVIYE